MLTMFTDPLRFTFPAGGAQLSCLLHPWTRSELAPENYRVWSTIPGLIVPHVSARVLSI